jgi:ACS family sodium-dependent inorganic phosphate cotransporter
MQAPVWVYVALLSVSFGACAFAKTGLFCTHQELSPRYAEVLFGLTCTAGAVPGVLGVWAAGCILDATGSWAAAIFWPLVFFQVGYYVCSAHVAFL